ncbi:MAG: hypothetical protein AB1454_03250 [Candidatus Auribacterota bacterium]|jgi:hypothetical protein|uniref:Uncharacterized protein n=1 Tax=Candidatus Auribacter fodinae TaxID=2093366 RepID=A0A3A4QT54_9BACT|nr:MAG: hypothetical protein C4541_11145 [Candidatus Auribacter fodinae]
MPLLDDATGFKILDIAPAVDMLVTLSTVQFLARMLQTIRQAHSANLSFTLFAGYFTVMNDEHY